MGDKESWHYWDKCALQSKVESGSATVQVAGARCQVLGRCGVCRYRRDIWLSPFCTTPIRQALTLNGETALLHAGVFCRASTDATLKKVRDDALPRPAAISRHCCGQNSTEDLHNEDRLPGRLCDSNSVFCDDTHTALVFKSARDGLQQRQPAVHAGWYMSAVASWEQGDCV